MNKGKTKELNEKRKRKKRNIKAIKKSITK